VKRRVNVVKGKWGIKGGELSLGFPKGKLAPATKRTGD